VWLAWDIALWAAAAFVAGWFVTRHRAGVNGRVVAPLCKEAAIMFVAYACWMALGETRFMGTEDSAARARWIWDAEKWLPFPSELTLQRWTLHSKLLVQFANAYYIVFHVAPMGIFIVWLYVRHREHFARWRNHLAFLSIVGALIQFIPVAPPRLFPELGFIDTAALYGPRVYDSSGFSQPGQLAAMPSMHVGWAMLIAFATFSAGRTRWRWLGPAHGALTIFAVTVTGYHWHLDGIVAIIILLVGMSIERAVRRRKGAVQNSEVTSERADAGLNREMSVRDR
jgi:PAP2 superfamily